MNTIDLKTQVAAAVAVRWDDFAARHPNLAGVIDQTLLIENVTDALASDAEYQEAMTTVREIGAGLDIVVGIVDRYVIRFIGKLMS